MVKLNEIEIVYLNNIYGSGLANIRRFLRKRPSQNSECHYRISNNRRIILFIYPCSVYIHTKQLPSHFK